jgi:hypothetical protein
MERPEIMVLHFLAARWSGTEESPAREDQIHALFEKRPINQKILLFGTKRGLDPFRGRVAQDSQDAQCLSIESIHGPEQRCLLVQRLAGIGTKSARYIKSLVFT